MCPASPPTAICLVMLLSSSCETKILPSLGSNKHNGARFFCHYQHGYDSASGCYIMPYSYFWIFYCEAVNREKISSPTWTCRIAFDRTPAHSRRSSTPVSYAAGERARKYHAPEAGRFPHSCRLFSRSCQGSSPGTRPESCISTALRVRKNLSLQQPVHFSHTLQ